VLSSTDQALDTPERSISLLLAKENDSAVDTGQAGPKRLELSLMGAGRTRDMGCFKASRTRVLEFRVASSELEYTESKGLFSERIYRNMHRTFRFDHDGSHPIPGCWILEPLGVRQGQTINVMRIQAYAHQCQSDEGHRAKNEFQNLERSISAPLTLE
jgi:hypothetical protein